MKRAALPTALLLAACVSGLAHELSETRLSLKYPGPDATFKLANSSNETNCTTTISISVNGDAVRVSPMVVQYTTPPDTSATFTVTPVKTGTATITVTWIAGTSDTCNGRGTPTIAVTVETGIVVPRLPSMKKRSSSRFRWPMARF